MAGFSQLTIKQLFGLSMNVCAFPACEKHLIDTKWYGVLGEICHICAASPGGPRYDVGMTDEERYAFDNLILLCPTHHTLIDRLEPHIYTIDVLREMKEQMIERAMPGSKGMLEQLGDAFVVRAIAEIIVVSERYYSLPPLPPMLTTNPVLLEGRAHGTSTVTGEVTVPLGGLTVGAEGLVVSDSADTSGLRVNFTAGTGSTSEDVMTVGGPGVSLEHEVIRRAEASNLERDSTQGSDSQTEV
jgi:hypothetical protein